MTIRPWLTEEVIAETHYMADGSVVEIDHRPVLPPEIRDAIEAERQRYEAWNPLEFKPGYQPTEAEREWLVIVNKKLRDQLREDQENLAIFGTTEVPK